MHLSYLAQDTCSHACIQVLDLTRNELGPLPVGAADLPAFKGLRELGADADWLAENVLLLECLPALVKLQLDTGHRRRDTQWDSLLRALAQAPPQLAVLSISHLGNLIASETVFRLAYFDLLLARPSLQVIGSNDMRGTDSLLRNSDPEA
jgi:hypothetical protein